MQRPPRRTPRRRLIAGAAIAVAGAVSLSGCAGVRAEPAPDGPPAVQAAAAALGHTEAADLPEPEPYPTWDTAARASAVAAATAAMTAFARPRLHEGAWWAQLAPLLSPAAAAAYQDTDPASVPAQAVTGPAVLVDERSPYLAGVDVPTDAGTYRVLLSRTGQGAPWLVERLTPPPALHRPAAGQR